MNIVKLIPAVNENSLPKLFVQVDAEDLQGEVVTHTRVFCHFRRYDWCWTHSPAGEFGYGSGMDVCNGGGRHLPAVNVEGFIATTLGVVFDRMMQDLLLQVRATFETVPYNSLDEKQRHALFTAESTVYSVADFSREPLRLLLEDALNNYAKNGNRHFRRAFEGYTGGCAAFPEPVTRVGFEDAPLVEMIDRCASDQLDWIVRNAKWDIDNALREQNYGTAREAVQAACEKLIAAGAKGSPTGASIALKASQLEGELRAMVPLRHTIAA